MKKLLLALLLLGGLALPASASAHTYYLWHTFGGSPWSNTQVTSNPGLSSLSCGQAVGLAAGQTKYIRNASGSTTFGLAILDGTHLHGDFDSVTKTGAETASFFSTTYRTEVNTRRVWYTLSGFGYKAVKFVNSYGYGIFVHANC